MCPPVAYSFVKYVVYLMLKVSEQGKMASVFFFGEVVLYKVIAYICGLCQFAKLLAMLGAKWSKIHKQQTERQLTCFVQSCKEQKHKW